MRTGAPRGAGAGAFGVPGLYGRKWGLQRGQPLCVGPPATGGLCSACPGPSFHCSEGRGGAASGPGLQRARVCGLRSGPAPSDVLVLIMWPFASQAIGVAITSWSEM